jgi:arylsulfatase A-like enzyme
MTKVGMPGAKEGWQKTDVTMATVLKSQGYATGQFGKNHQGDRDEHLPTMHGFDEFLGSLYHLNAEEEPENRDYPRDMKLPTARPSSKPSARAACSSARPTARAARPSRTSARSPRSGWRPSTTKRSPPPRISSPASTKAGKPFFCWWNGTRMHFRTHVKESTSASPARTNTATAWSSTTCTSASCSS